MTGEMALIELLFSFAVILAILFWELYSVKRSQRDDAKKNRIDD